MIHSYELDGLPVSVQVEGETVRGPPCVLLAEDDDLTRGTAMEADGYTVAPFLSARAHALLIDDVCARVIRGVRAAGGQVPDAPTLTDYHTYVGDDATHLRAINEARVGYALADFAPVLDEVCARVSALVGAPVTPHNAAYGLDRWHVRIVRPGARDNNPLHRDVWLDRLRNAVNLYVPIAGSDRHSSLPLVPGSHRWPESDIERTTAGATVDGLSYTVPAVVGSAQPLTLVRPDPRPNELLLFSPYLVHGGGFNRNPHTTRVSLEMRFWRAA